MQATIPLTRELVLIGGGHTHALVLRMWGMNPLPGVRLTLINPDPTAPYTGMLPGHVAGHYTRDDLDIDLVRLARHAGARLILGHATAIDREQRRITITGRADIFYDVASIDIGITSEMQLPGFSEHAHAAKPLGAFSRAWEAFVSKHQNTAEPQPITVIGGGVAGVELALAMAHRMQGRAKITLLESSDALLAGVAKRTRSALLGHLREADIALLTSENAVRITASGIALASGRVLSSVFTVGAAGASAQSWLAQTGLDLTHGYVTITPQLHAITDPLIFAVGDCAHMQSSPRPKAGVFAVRQAPVLLHNLRAALMGTDGTRFTPQSDYLKLISTGTRNAVADKFGVCVDASWVWRLKDRIDRKFMAQFTSLKPMPSQPVPHQVALGVREELGDQQALCGGCGAKLGQRPLRDVLSELAPHTRADVLSGPGDDAAILGFGKMRQVITTDHIRAFSQDPWIFARITAIHAMGDIWAMGAKPQSALVSLTLPQMRDRMQQEMLREIMSAATEAFGAAGADIIGGHTSVGAELSLGFTVTGLPGKRIIGQDGAQKGDAILLTKPLGTGVILAAEMAMRANGNSVACALASMVRPQDRTAETLALKATAMTDVTGFGLAGHLLGILTASGVGARLDLAALPLLPGAEALAAAGVRSTLFTSNASMLDQIDIPESPRRDLLLDPQTAGGLLATVPAKAAASVIRALHAQGVPAVQIGEITDGPARITC